MEEKPLGRDWKVRKKRKKKAKSSLTVLLRKGTGYIQLWCRWRRGGGNKAMFGSPFHCLRICLSTSYTVVTLSLFCLVGKTMICPKRKQLTWGRGLVFYHAFTGMTEACQAPCMRREKTLDYCFPPTCGPPLTFRAVLCGVRNYQFTLLSS